MERKNQYIFLIHLQIKSGKGFLGCIGGKINNFLSNNFVQFFFVEILIVVTLEDVVAVCLDIRRQFFIHPMGGIAHGGILINALHQIAVDFFVIIFIGVAGLAVGGIDGVFGLVATWK